MATANGMPEPEPKPTIADSLRKRASEITAISLITLTVFAIVGGTLWGCSMANNHYYDAMNNCVSSGGSWVPSGDWKAACVAGYRK